MVGRETGRLRKIIVPFPVEICAGYLRARKLTRGRLPSNVLHDDYLVRNALRGDREYEYWRDIEWLYPAWAREILVYPEKDGQFKKGRDVVDSHKDKEGRKWIFPGSYVPQEATGRKKVGLFVDPEEITEENDKVVVHAKPKSIVVLNGFLQENGAYGKADEATRIPLEADLELLEKLPHRERRWLKRQLCRNDGMGVNPLHRSRSPGFHRFSGDDSVVVFHYGVDRCYGVAVEVPVEETAKLQANVPLDELTMILLAADKDIGELEKLKNVPHERLEATRRLVQALEIKK